MGEKTGKLQLEIFPTGALGTNAYVVFDEQTKEGCLIDCPAPIDVYRDFIVKNDVSLKFLILTHGHCDHIDGVNDFLEEFSIPFYVQENDLPLLVNPLKNGSLVFGPAGIFIKQPPIFCSEKTELVCGKYQLQIIETPGHTPGSISIKINDWLFSGDTLFYHSIGRTDFPFSDKAQLFKSLQEKILLLPPQTVVYPGHGPATTLAEEIENNPFIS